MRRIWFRACSACAVLIICSAAVAADRTSVSRVDRVGGVVIGQSFSDLRSGMDAKVSRMHWGEWEATQLIEGYP